MRASLVAHRGPTSVTGCPRRASLAYLPDHEPGLGERLDAADARWIRATGSLGTRRFSFTMPITPTTVRGAPRVRPLEPVGRARVRASIRPTPAGAVPSRPEHDDERLLALGAEAAALVGPRRRGGDRGAREGRAFDLSSEDDPGVALGAASAGSAKRTPVSCSETFHRRRASALVARAPSAGPASDGRAARRSRRGRSGSHPRGPGRWRRTASAALPSRRSGRRVDS